MNWEQFLACGIRAAHPNFHLHLRFRWTLPEEEGEAVSRRSGGEGAGAAEHGRKRSPRPPPGTAAEAGQPRQPPGATKAVRAPESPRGEPSTLGSRGKSPWERAGVCRGRTFQRPPVSRPPPRLGGDSSGGGAAAAERSAGRSRPRLARAPRPPLPGAAERARRLPRRAGGGGCGRAPPRRAREGRGELGRGRGAAPPAQSVADWGCGAAREGCPGAAPPRWWRAGFSHRMAALGTVARIIPCTRGRWDAASPPCPARGSPALPQAPCSPRKCGSGNSWPRPRVRAAAPEGPGGSRWGVSRSQRARPGSRPAARSCQLEPPAEELPPTSRERAPSAKRPSAAPPHRGAAAPSRAAGAGPAPSPCAPCERGPGRGRAGPRLPQRIGMRARAPRPQRPERLGERSLPAASPRSISAASGACGGQRNAAGLHRRCGPTRFGEGSSAPLRAIFFCTKVQERKVS